MTELCYMHNPSEQPPAEYVMRVPIGNELPLCAACCAWWRQSAVDEPDDEGIQPVWIRQVAR